LDISQNSQNIASNTSLLTQHGLNISQNSSNIASNVSSNQTIDGIKNFNSSPTAPTLSPSDNSTKLATTAYVDIAIGNLINSAPCTLDTLGEIATLLQTNENGITAITNSMVDISSNQTVIGTKTFSTSPVVPTQTQGENSTKVASTSYVDTGLALKASTASLSSHSFQHRILSVAPMNIHLI
jgi:hypothetical protein